MAYQETNIDKVYSVINSCNTLPQLEGAENYLNLWYKQLPKTTLKKEWLKVMSRLINSKRVLILSKIY